MAGTATAIEFRKALRQVIALAGNLVSGGIGEADLFAGQDIRVVIKSQGFVEEAHPFLSETIILRVRLLPYQVRVRPSASITPWRNSSNVAGDAFDLNWFIHIYAVLQNDLAAVDVLFVRKYGPPTRW